MDHVQRNDNSVSLCHESVHSSDDVNECTRSTDDPETLCYTNGFNYACDGNEDSKFSEKVAFIKSDSMQGVTNMKIKNKSHVEDVSPVVCNGNISLTFKQGGNQLQSIDEDDSENEDAGKPEKPNTIKGIVKTSSDHNFGRRILSRNNSIRSPNAERNIKSEQETDRPVLRVQFKHGGVDGSVTTDPCASPSFSIDDSSGSSSTSEDDSSLGLAEARAPDGGWGWVVVFATFMVNLIADGITFSFGVMYVNFLEYFGESKAKTAWIGSLFMAMPLLSGPIASFLTDRYGCRKMCIIGSLLASLGFITSTFAKNMETLFFTFGIVSGFGLSLCYVAAVVIVAYYFEKKRSFATGLSVCGSGIGTFIFAPLTQFLLDAYGWRGTTLILAGIFLNITVCGVLMKDLEWISIMAKTKAEDRKRHREQKRMKKYSSSGDSFSDNKSTNTAGTGTQLLLNADSSLTDENVECGAKQFCSLVNLPTYVNNGENVPVEVLELLATHKNVYNVLMLNYPSMLISKSFSDNGRLHEMEVHKGISSNEATSPSNMIRSPTELTRVPRTPPRPQTAYLKDLRLHRHSLTYRGAMLNIKRYRLRASSCPNIYRNSMTTIAKEKLQWYAGLWEFWDVIVDMLDFSHFANPHFLLFAVSNFLLYTWYDVPYVYISDNAVEMGFSERDGSCLISIIGIINMIGEILLGWAGDVEWLNAGSIYATSMVLCGGVTALVPLLSSYYGLCMVSGAFGFFIAANYSLTSIILVELISLENFTNAYGLLLLVQGIANLIGPPLAGWLYDIKGSYDMSFYLAGLFIVISGLLLLILPIMKKLKKYRALHRKETASASISSIDDNSNIANSNCIIKKEKKDHIFV